MLTSSREEQDLIRAATCWARTHVVKPVDFRGFIDVARQLGRFWAVVNERLPRRHDPAAPMSPFTSVRSRHENYLGIVLGYSNLLLEELPLMIHAAPTLMKLAGPRRRAVALMDQWSTANSGRRRQVNTLAKPVLLVVDDEPGIVKLIDRFATKIGFEVMTAKRP